MFWPLTALSYTTIGVVVAVCVALYYYATRKFDYWSSRGINGPKPVPLLGNLWDVLFKNLTDVEEERYAKYGKIYGIFQGAQPMLSVADPEIIKDIMIKDFNKFVNRVDKKDPLGDPIMDRMMTIIVDDDWKNMRSIISPTFSSGKMKRMHKLVEQCVDSLDTKLESVAKNDKEVELKKLMGDYTMDVIASCAFGTKTDTHNDPDNPFVKHALLLFKTALWRNMAFFVLGKLCKVLRISIIDPKMIGFFNKVIKEIIKQRANNPKLKHEDFLQLMLNAKNNKNVDESEDTLNDLESHHGTEGNVKLSLGKTNVQLTDEDILANGFLFFFAGYETTANLLSRLFYCLALDPECQQKLFEEVQQNCDQNGKIDYEGIARLPYLDACISETLRLHNPAPQTMRVCSEEYTLGDTGITLPKGSTIMIPIHSVHHSPEFYPNPHRFDPERFMPENRDKLVPYTYLPFGAGPRNCVGMRFALMEAKAAVVRIIRKFEFTRTEKTKVPLVMISTMLMNPTDITVGVKVR